VLTERQVVEYGLPESIGKEKSTDVPELVARYGRNVQVEVDALDPAAVMRQLFEDAIAPYLDSAAHAAVLEREERDRAELAKLSS
jgi:hypothetical protein